MEAVCCSCQLAIFSAAYGLNRIYPPHRSLAIKISKIMSGETAYTLLFSRQEYADIKAEEEIILILNTRVTAVSRTVQDIDSGENSNTSVIEPSILHGIRILLLTSKVKRITADVEYISEGVLSVKVWLKRPGSCHYNSFYYSFKIFSRF